MTIHSDQDLAGLRRVGRTVAEVLRALRDDVRPGVTTGELGARCAELLEARGARPAPRDDYGFPGALCISVNDEAVHGVPGRRVLERGDLVKLDLVAQSGGYYADAALTVGVGPLAARDRALVRATRRAFQKALRAIRPGRPVREIGRAIDSEVRRAGFSVMPGLGGHGVGRAIHEPPEVPNFADPRARGVLHEGLVLAVEPIVAAGGGAHREDGDGWTIRTADGSRVAHHEHTLVVTRGAPLLLTAA